MFAVSMVLRCVCLHRLSPDCGLYRKVVCFSLLIIDKTREKGYLGDNWKEQFLDIINNMTESVFYNPKDISYTIAPESQEKFEKLLSTPIYHYINSLK